MSRKPFGQIITGEDRETVVCSWDDVQTCPFKDKIYRKPGSELETPRWSFETPRLMIGHQMVSIM